MSKFKLGNIVSNVSSKFVSNKHMGDFAELNLRL